MGAARREAGQCWSLSLVDAAEVSGGQDAITPSCCSSCLHVHAFRWERVEDLTKPRFVHVHPRAAWPAARALHALQMWAENPWGEKKLITLQTLIFEALLSTHCLSDFHCSVGCQPLLWRYFKIVSPVSDHLTLSRYHQDCFCFHCRGEELECQGSLHLINPFCSLLKCVFKLMTNQLQWGNFGAETLCPAKWDKYSNPWLSLILCQGTTH